MSAGAARTSALLVTVAVATSTWIACDVPSVDGADEDPGSVRPGNVLAQMHMMNITMIEAAQLAEDRAADDDVLDYADRLQKDHSFADGKVVSMAHQLHVDLDAVVAQLRQTMRSMDAPGQGQREDQGVVDQGVVDQGEGDETPRRDRPHIREARGVVPRQLADMKALEREVENLRQLEGPDFDRQFVRLMKRAHEMSVDDLSRARAQLRAEALGNMLSDIVPILEQHVALARSLEQRSRS